MRALRTLTTTVAGLAALAFLTAAPAAAGPLTGIELSPIAQLALPGETEIVAHDPASQRLFVINGDSGGVDVISLANPAAPALLTTLDISAFGAGANSVAVSGGVVAVAVEADPAQNPGRVVFYTPDGTVLSSVEVGPLPDMVTFTPDGRAVVVANEGEPVDYCDTGLAVDPEGSVSIIDISGGAASLTQANVRTAGFGAFNAGVPEGVRIFGPGATPAQDLEPEYVAVSPDSSTAWVTLQENNALAVVDLASATITDILPLGLKDHSVAGNAMDPSDRDDTVRILPQPVYGMYQPDAVTAYRSLGVTYLITANEGDARDYDCYSEEERVADLTLDPGAYPNAAALQSNLELGRLKTTSANGDTDGDGDVDKIHTYGGRSFSIWTTAGELVYDSGDELEKLTAVSVPEIFNSSGPGEDVDGRSDDKGPEPEAVTTGFFRGRTYAFIGLERTGGIMVYDVTNPRRPFFVQYADNIVADPETGDLSAKVGTVLDQGPEGVIFIPQNESPTNRALLVVAHEVSGTVTVYSVLPRPLS